MTEVDRLHPGRTLRRRWTCPTGMAASLTHYPAAGRQSRHVHDHTQVTFLLAGELLEQVERREHRPCGSALGYKPAGAAHSDQWGRRGALLFTIKLPEPLAEGLEREPGWGVAADQAAVGPLVRLFVEAQEDQTQADALGDLLSLTGAARRRPGAPPAWLTRAREHLLDCAAPLEEVARAVGVHRVQLSRAFRSYYGVPPSLFRRRAMAGRAVDAVLRSGTPLSEAALDAGFYDQAHLTRCLRLDTGLGPRALRSVLATSIQSPRRGGA